MHTAAEKDVHPHLERRFGLLQAAALNMSNMIGVGPFITIPLLMSALAGPQSLLGWAVALLICIPDSLVWSELGAALPGSGGTYLYLKEAFGRSMGGRLLAFLFIWQFIISGPFEIASGYIGFSNYLGYVWPQRTQLETNLVMVAMGLVTIFLLYRRISSIGKITVSLWVGTMVTTLAVIVLGIMNFNPSVAFDFPPDAFKFSLGFLLGLGAAARVGIYDFLGYYDVCYIGEEVRDPGRVIPRSIIISLLLVAGIYVGINLSIIGVISWREFVPAEGNPKAAFIVSVFMEQLVGAKAASLFTLMILWTAFASVFALMLGYSRIPYAAALDGNFFRVFGKLHPTKDFPHRSLLAIGTLSILFSFFSLQTVIDALITSRIMIQFIGQIFAVHMIRKHRPDLKRPFKMWLYPLPSLIALLGWLFLLATTKVELLRYTFILIFAGILAFALWQKFFQKVDA